MEPPKYPKDDSTISRKATPESKGACPCRHCGSGKHWDNECKHSFKAAKAARTHRVTCSVDEEEAQEDYDELYYSLDSDEEVEASSRMQGFEEPLQTAEFLVGTELNSGLGGANIEEVSTTSETSKNDLTTVRAATLSARQESEISKVAGAPKLPLNRRTRRRLARDVSVSNHVVTSGTSQFKSSKPLVELKKFMARPPGCSFLGSKAMKAEGFLSSSLLRL